MRSFVSASRRLQAGPHISIVLPDLRGGGAERLHVHLANEWVRRGFTVNLVLMNNGGDLLQSLSDNVTVVSLDVGRIRRAIIPLRRYLNARRPSVILAAMWPLTTVTAVAWLLAGKPGKLFLSDHTQLSVSCARELHVDPFWVGASIGMSYRVADGIIAVSRGVRLDLARLGRLDLGAIRVIYNPAATGAAEKFVANRDSRKALWGGSYKYNILSVGSLKEQKDHETLIRAFGQLPSSLEAKLIILGDGPMRPRLEQLILELGLTSRISLPGYVSDPYPWFQTSDLFVLSSRWEGFGNVIVEALECGVPVVSTDCPSGPAEILENGRFGRLVPASDPDSLMRAMILTLNEPHDRQALIARAREFSVQRIAEQYLEYFEAS